MNIKTDENIPRRVVQTLAQLGHDVATVRDQELSGAADARVFDAVVREERLLVTLDRGFGDIRLYPPGTHAGIVIFRSPDQSPERVDRLLRELIEVRDLRDFAGCTVIAQPVMVRIRRPQPDS